MTKSQSGLLNIEQAAAYLGYDVRHMRRLVSDRRIAVIKERKLLRFDVRDLDAWINRYRREAIER